MEKDATNIIYEMVIIAIENTEKECNKYKKNIEDLPKKRFLKLELSNLHEIRRTIERLKDFKENKKGLKC